MWVTTIGRLVLNVKVTVQGQRMSKAYGRGNEQYRGRSDPN